MRDICEIAKEIETTWKKVNYAARPYLDAMKDVKTMADYYFSDKASSLVVYFLSNASTWHGDDARRIKAELKGML